MNIHIKNFLIGAFGWAIALIFLGIFANACWNATTTTTK
jgi:hypothetical protein